MDVSRETPDVTTKPKCYDLANILTPNEPNPCAQGSCVVLVVFYAAQGASHRRTTYSHVLYGLRPSQPARLVRLRFAQAYY